MDEPPPRLTCDPVELEPGRARLVLEGSRGAEPGTELGRAVGSAGGVGAGRSGPGTGTGTCGSGAGGTGGIGGIRTEGTGSGVGGESVGAAASAAAL